MIFPIDINRLQLSSLGEKRKAGGENLFRKLLTLYSRYCQAVGNCRDKFMISSCGHFMETSIFYILRARVC